MNSPLPAVTLSYGALDPSLADLAALSDEQLLALVGFHHEAALSMIYTRYARKVYVIAARITGDPHTAEEVVQDVFLKIWQTAASFKPDDGRFVAWLNGIVRHRSIDATRSGQVRARQREQQALPETWPVDDTLLPDQALERREIHETVRHALDQLPSPQREAIELAYYRDLTRGEIAAYLGQPLGTIKTRLRLGLDKLRNLLDPCTDPGAPR